MNGLRAWPECCLEAPLVVSATAWLGLAGAWLIATDAVVRVTLEEAARGVGVELVEEPEPSTA